MATRGPNYKIRNRNTIERAFKNLSSREESLCEVIMRNVARDGLNELIEKHELSSTLFGHTHSRHLEEINTLAYALSHEGRVVESGYHKGPGNDDLPGDAENKARRIAGDGSGWVAVILADMENLWYHFEYTGVPHEEDMLLWSEENIRNKLLSGKSSEYVTPGSIPKPR